MSRFNRWIEGLQPSKSMTAMARARQMKAQDPEILDLVGGEPDFPTPAGICMEMFRQVSEGYTHYTVGAGLPELRQRIARKLLEENDCRYDPEGIIVTPGGKYAIYLAVRTLVNPGDEVIYLTPAWVSYSSIIEAAGGIPVAAALDREAGYRVSEEALETACTRRTKLLIINYPNNPTGKILTPEDAAALRAFLARHPELLVISDEIYERIVFDGRQNLSLAAIPELRPRVITVNGFSKSAAMTGWRVGYLAAEPEIAKCAYKLFQHTISCVSGFIQKAAVVALDSVDDIERMRRKYEERRNMFIGALNEIPGVYCDMPEGAFYAWVRFEVPGMDAEQICTYLLERAKVVGVPGISYGETSAPYMRFCFAADDAVLRQAAENINQAMGQLRK